MNEEQFKQQLQEQGYGETVSVDYEPNAANDMHTHDFDAFVFVLSGEITLVTEDDSATHKRGETCKLAANTLHLEQAGGSGATILVGRK